jgi:hypothetical protein
MQMKGCTDNVLAHDRVPGAKRRNPVIAPRVIAPVSFGEELFEVVIPGRNPAAFVTVVIPIACGE